MLEKTEDGAIRNGLSNDTEKKTLKIQNCVIKNCKSKDRQYNGQEKGKTMLYKALDRKLH